MSNACADRQTQKDKSKKVRLLRQNGAANDSLAATQARGPNKRRCDEAVLLASGQPGLANRCSCPCSALSSTPPALPNSIHRMQPESVYITLPQIQLLQQKPAMAGACNRCACVQAGMGAAVFHSWSERLAPHVQVGLLLLFISTYFDCITSCAASRPGCSLTTAQHTLFAMSIKLSLL